MTQTIRGNLDHYEGVYGVAEENKRLANTVFYKAIYPNIDASFLEFLNQLKEDNLTYKFIELIVDTSSIELTGRNYFGVTPLWKENVSQFIEAHLFSPQEYLKVLGDFGPETRTDSISERLTHIYSDTIRQAPAKGTGEIRNFYLSQPINYWAQGNILGYSNVLGYSNDESGPVLLFIRDIITIDGDVVQISACAIEPLRSYKMGNITIYYAVQLPSEDSYRMILQSKAIEDNAGAVIEELGGEFEFELFEPQSSQFICPAL